MLEEWAYLKRQGHYLRTFDFRGVNLFPVLERLFDGIVQERIGMWMALSDHLFKAFRKERIGAVVVPTDTPPLARLLVLIGNELGLPTLVVQHGMKGHTCQVHDMHTAKYAAVWSEWVRKNRLDGARNLDGIFVIGSLFDRYERVHANPSVSRVLGDVRILVLPQGHLRASAFSERLHVGKFLDLVMSALEAAGIIGQVIIKPHPGMRSDYYRQFTSVQRKSDLQVQVRRGPLETFLDWSGVLIGGDSTGTLEALVCHKRVICVNVTQRSFAPPLDGNGVVPVARNHEELKDILHQVLIGDAARYGDAEIEPFLGPVDGKSISRLAGLIDNLVELGKKDQPASQQGDG